MFACVCSCTYAPIWAIWYAVSMVVFPAETAAVSSRRGRLVFVPSVSKALINSYRWAEKVMTITTCILMAFDIFPTYDRFYGISWTDFLAKTLKK